MAKTPKSNDEEKIVKDNVQKRFKNMFSGESEPPSTMSLKEVEALKARVTELETQLGKQRTAPSGYKPAVYTVEPVNHSPSSGTPDEKAAAIRAEIQQEEPVAPAAQDKRVAVWITGILAAVGFIFLVLSLYIVFVLQGGVWELSDKVVMPFTVLMFIASLIGMRLVQRGRPVLGIWLTYLVSIILGPILVVLVIKNFYVIMGAYLVLFTFIFVLLILPKTSRRPAFLIAVSTLLVMGGIEIWDPPFRLTTEQIQNFSLMVLGPAAVGILALFFITNQFRNPGIQSRLTVLMMTVMIPLMVVVGLIFVSIAQGQMETGASTQLQGSSSGLASGISTWLELNTSALRQLTLQPDIISMDAEQQQPVLQTMAKAYPYMYLVSTTDLRGINIARNDNGALTNYSDRDWFKGASTGSDITYQSLIGKTTGQPALVISMPIRNSAGRILGVGMFAADLIDLIKETQVSTFGERGFTFLVDANNLTLAHPDPKVTADLRDMSNYPPVVAARQGKTGLITFTEENGESWRAYTTVLDNGWIVIAQRPESEIIAPIRQIQVIVFLLIMIISVVMLALVWFTIRRTLQPVTALTETASAIAAGDLNRFADVDTRDEIGKLAHAFNVMTSQVRSLVEGLEQRVADRTHDLELAAEVSRTVTEKVKQQSEMLTEAVEMIRARFDFYYTQVYLTEPAGERLILSAGTGDVGKQLLQRGHHLIINSGSLNGRAVLDRRAQIVPDTAKNPSFLPNPLLPKTRSEMCVPLIVDEKVVGVLDMQSDQPEALSESNLPAFEALAGQLAIAIRNATLFMEAQQARTEAEAQMSHTTEEGWDDFLNAIQEGHRIGFAFENSQVIRLKTEELTSASRSDRFDMPITVTGAKVGKIQLPVNLKPSDLELVKSVSEQLAQHVENLRLLSQAERFQKEAEESLNRLMHEGWTNYLSTLQAGTGYVYDLNQVRTLSENNGHATEQAFKQPLVVREETIGELQLDLSDASGEVAEIVAAVAQQLSGHLETLRLSEINEKHAQREKTLREITSILRSSTNPATIMRTAASEVGKILGRRTVVQVLSPEQAEAVHNNENKTDSSADQS